MAAGEIAPDSLASYRTLLTELYMPPPVRPGGGRQGDHRADLGAAAGPPPLAPGQQRHAQARGPGQAPGPAGPREWPARARQGLTSAPSTRVPAVAAPTRLPPPRGPSAGVLVRRQPRPSPWRWTRRWAPCTAQWRAKMPDAEVIDGIDAKPQSLSKAAARGEPVLSHCNAILEGWAAQAAALLARGQPHRGEQPASDGGAPCRCAARVGSRLGCSARSVSPLPAEQDALPHAEAAATHRVGPPERRLKACAIAGRQGGPRTRRWTSGAAIAARLTGFMEQLKLPAARIALGVSAAGVSKPYARWRQLDAQVGRWALRLRGSHARVVCTGRLAVPLEGVRPLPAQRLTGGGPQQAAGARAAPGADPRRARPCSSRTRWGRPGRTSSSWARWTRRWRPSSPAARSPRGPAGRAARAVLLPPHAARPPPSALGPWARQHAPGGSGAGCHAAALAAPAAALQTCPAAQEGAWPLLRARLWQQSRADRAGRPTPLLCTPHCLVTRRLQGHRLGGAAAVGCRDARPGLRRPQRGPRSRAVRATGVCLQVLRQAGAHGGACCARSATRSSRPCTAHILAGGQLWERPRLGLIADLNRVPRSCTTPPWRSTGAPSRPVWCRAGLACTAAPGGVGWQLGARPSPR